MSVVSKPVPLKNDARDGGGKDLLSQAFHYITSSGLAVLSSMVSYPMLTRMLTQSDYGLMSLISTGLTILVAISKLGLPNAAVRFYFHYDEGEDRLRFCSSLFWVPVFVATAVSLFVTALVAGGVFGLSWEIRRLLIFAALIAVLESAKALLLSFYRAAQLSKRVSVITAIDRYGFIAVGLSLVATMHGRLAGWYIGWLVWDALLTAALFVHRLLNNQLSFQWYHPEIIKSTLSFSAPLILNELGNLTLAYADRYLIATYMGTSTAGVYAAAYNLTITIQYLLLTPLTAIIFPWASKLWNTGKEAEAKEFISRVFDYFVLISFPIAVGISTLRISAMEVFASDKYVGAAILLPLLISAQVAYGIYTILIVGLFLKKQSAAMAKQLLTGTGINLVANLVLIPRIGMMGAAIAMCISNGTLVVLAVVRCRNLLRIAPDWIFIAKVVFSAAVMSLVIQLLPHRSQAFHLLGGTFLGACTYVVTMLLCDRKLRTFVLDKLAA